MAEHRTTIIIVAAIVLLAGLVAGWAFISSGDQEVSAAPLKEISDTATIQSNVLLSHLSIATSENFAKQRIYVISAYLKNLSEQPLRMVEVKMTFTDFDGKPIREYRQKVIDKNQRRVDPGGEFRFEVRQENLPRGWN